MPSINNVTNAIIAAVTSFITSYLIWGTAKPYFAYLEWTGTFLLLNFFVFACFDNDYYSSVKQYKDE